MEYIFPFNTCEPSSDGWIAQPWSFSINIISVICLLWQTTRTKTACVKDALISFVCFELFHAYCHFTWNDNQRHIVHILGHIMSHCVFVALRHLTQDSKRFPFMLYTLAGSVDVLIYIWTWGKGIIPVLTGLSVLTTVVLSHFHCIPKSILNRFTKLVCGTAVLFLMFVNELFNCESMLKTALLPYHAVIEIWGLGLFIYLGDTFLEWERIKTI